MEYPLNVRKIIDLLPTNNLHGSSLNYLAYMQAHKGTAVTARLTEIMVDFEYEESMKDKIQTSPGIRIQVRLDPGNHYELRVRASLLRGDRAFIYCEDSNNIRLIPRVHIITPETRNQTFVIEFVALTEKNWVGVLFFQGDKNYSLLIEQFTVREISDKEIGLAPQGPVLTKLLPEAHFEKRCLPIYGGNHAQIIRPDLPINTRDTKEIDLIDQLRQNNVIYMIDGFSKKPKPHVQESLSPLAFMGITWDISPQVLIQSQTIRKEDEVKSLWIPLSMASTATIGRSGAQLLSHLQRYIHIPYELDGEWIKKLHMPDYIINRCPDYQNLTSLLGLLPILKEPAWILLSFSSIPDDLFGVYPKADLFELRRYIGSEKGTNSMKAGILDCIDFDNKTIMFPSNFIDVDIYQILQENLYLEFDAFELLLTYFRFSKIALPTLPLLTSNRLDYVHGRLKKKLIWQDPNRIEKIVKTLDPSLRLPGLSSHLHHIASEALQVSEAKISEVPEVSEVSEVSEIPEIPEVSEVLKISEVSEVSEVLKISEVPEVPEVSNLVEEVKAVPVGLIEPVAAGVTVPPVAAETETEMKKPIRRQLAIEKTGRKVNDKVAVIVELRANIHLINIIAHFLRRLDRSWIIQVFHGTSNEKLLRDSEILKPYIVSNQVIMTNLKKSSMTKREYSTLLLSESFYKSCLCSPNGHILIFKMESYLNDNPEKSINSFLKYDYVGSPYSDKLENLSLLNGLKRLEIGSGNLSLRKKARMLHICALLKQRRFRKLFEKNEDRVISSFLLTPMLKSIKLPTREEALLFSVESEYHPGCIGGYKPWEHHDHSTLTKIASECSDFKELFRKHLSGTIN